MTIIPNLPLSVLLAQALIALTRDFERAGAGTPPVPSLAVWSNILRLVGDESVSPRELPRLSRLSKRAVRAAVGNLERQGWAIVESDPADSRVKTVRLTDRGRMAREAWRPMAGVVEERWRARFGAARTEALRASLAALVGQLDLELPHYPAGYGPADLSITGGNGQDWSPTPRGEGDTVSALPVSALLSQALVAFALDYESEAGIALAHSANVIRFLGGGGLPIKALPSRAWLATLERHHYIVIETDPVNPRERLARLTPRGRRVRHAYDQHLREIERRWQTRYGAEVIQALRTSLEAVVGLLDAGLPHYPHQ